MSVVVVIDPPVDPVVSLEEAKAHLRITDGDDDDYIQGLVATATSSLDGPTGWLGRALVTQTLEWRGEAFDYEGVRLLYPPVASITSVKYDDANGAEQVMPSTLYRVVGGDSSPVLAVAHGSSWPGARRDAEAIRIRYVAGWPVEASGEGDNQVNTWKGPPAIKHAILLMVGHFYANAEAVNVGNIVTELPLGVDRLLASFVVQT